MPQIMYWKKHAFLLKVFFVKIKKIKHLLKIFFRNTNHNANNLQKLRESIVVVLEPFLIVLEPFLIVLEPFLIVLEPFLIVLEPCVNQKYHIHILIRKNNIDYAKKSKRI
jgi:hypothetical protein